ncbi:tautomerase family protein [Buttiauxella sp. A111]|uniref:tautomerase family protein n=1 Tax=Buttiauxella sp. A111 TaxID=2563088 RepID=UPI0010CEDD48|nr:tautomerase family protein [Buttiauxella sp. A111]GDX06618.1 tautomerase family protein [Buttiauxella sp. A111]
MPLINVYLPESKSDEFIDKLSQSLHEALMTSWGIPENDRFQIFNRKKANELQIDKRLFDIQRSDDVIVFHITTSPRLECDKLKFYDTLANNLFRHLGVRKEDVFISIIENTYSDWSFGNGLAQLIIK